MKCLVYRSEKVIIRPTKMSDFLVARIFGDEEAAKEHPVNLCHCEECSFSFYDRRLTDDESGRLYEEYRGDEYQKIRERYDCWYTKKVNDALNHEKVALSEQKRIIMKIIRENVPVDIKVALDYGGNCGETFTEQIGTDEKYVYDISGVDINAEGIKRITDYKELLHHQFDFIMCNMTLEHISWPKEFMKLLYDIGMDKTYYYLEVPCENPFERDKFSLMKNLKLFFNPLYGKVRLVKYYFNLKKQPYMPMSEHINFFTPKALRMLVSCCGFEVIDVQENYEKSVLGKNKVLSVVFRKSKKW